MITICFSLIVSLMLANTEKKVPAAKFYMEKLICLKMYYV